MRDAIIAKLNRRLSTHLKTLGLFCCSEANNNVNVCLRCTYIGSSCRNR